jgi:hypothetical protein
MLLSCAYLAFSAVLQLLVRNRRSDFAKDVELLVLRHQLFVLGRPALRVSAWSPDASGSATEQPMGLARAPGRDRQPRIRCGGIRAHLVPHGRRVAYIRKNGALVVATSNSEEARTVTTAHPFGSVRLVARRHAHPGDTDGQPLAARRSLQ